MSTMLSRRSVTAGMIGALGGLAGAGQAHAYPGVDTDYNPRGIPFMDQYLNGSVDIVAGIRDTQTDRITRAMREAYSRSQGGGSIFSNIFFGHYALYAGSKDRPGQPWLLPHYAALPRNFASEMKNGDFLITNFVGPAFNDARERGVFVCGVTNNYMRFDETPADGLNPDRMELSIGDVSDMVIDSQAPWYNGLVRTPKLPRFRICPSSGIAQYAVYWGCTASLAVLNASKGKDDGAAQVRRYLDLCLERFRLIESDRAKVDNVASTWADRVLRKGARVMVYGDQLEIMDGRTDSIFASDAIGTASSAMIPEYWSEDAGENDIVLIGSEYSNNPSTIDVARTARRNGAYTVAICPFTERGDASGDRLYKEVDVAFNSYSDEHGGVLDVRGFDDPVCPLSGLTGNLVMWMIIAQWTEHMLRRGEIPYYWMNHDERGGRQYDNAVRPYFLKRGY